MCPDESVLGSLLGVGGASWYTIVVSGLEELGLPISTGPSGSPPSKGMYLFLPPLVVRASSSALEAYSLVHFHFLQLHCLLKIRSLFPRQHGEF